MEKRVLRKAGVLPRTAKDNAAALKKSIYDAKRRKATIYKTAQPRIPATKQEYAEAYRIDKSPEMRAHVQKRLKEEAELEAERERCKIDLKYLWEVAFRVVVAHPETKEQVLQALGRIHDLMMDFCNLPILDEVVNYSPLKSWLPKFNKKLGLYPERWIYLPTLDSAPKIQDGAKGPLSKMFYEGTFFHGVLFRIKGNGRTLLNLNHRGSLKSSICSITKMLQELIRNPSSRNVLRAVNDELAGKFMQAIQHAFESRPHFKKLFGHLQPDSHKEGSWNAGMIQLNAERKGIDPTLAASGILSEKVGSHWGFAICDDIVGEKNTKNPTQIAKTGERFMFLQAQRDPGAVVLVNGTRWTEDDSNGSLLKEESNACFMLSTVLDDDRSVKVSQEITPLGHGKPMWEEWWSINTLIEKRMDILLHGGSDSFYFGQFFNQFAGTSARIFKKEWLQPIPEAYRHMSMPELAKALRLNISIGGDAASGDPEQAKGKKDNSGFWVMGQTRDKQHMYFLDGFCEKLPSELICKAIVDLAMRWKLITNSYKDEKTGAPAPGRFQVRLEKEAHQHHLWTLILNEQKRRGVSAMFRVEPAEHGNGTKPARISTLAPLYRWGVIRWPEELWVIPTVDDDEKQKEPYDLRLIAFKQQTTYTSSSTDDDLMDGQVYSVEGFTLNWAVEEGPKAPKDVPVPGQYSRKIALERAKELQHSMVGDSEELEMVLT